MTTMAMTESFDAPMMDFLGEDIPMQTSSSTSWIHPEATMDDDSNFNPNDVEIDMANYPQETFEYEMTDESPPEQLTEVHDVEVVDVSQAHTPALIDTVVEDATSASPAVPEHDLLDTHDRSPLESPPTLVVQVPSPTPQHPQQSQDDELHRIAEAETLEPSEWGQEPSVAPLSPQLHMVTLSTESAAELVSAWDPDVPVEQKAHSREPTPTPVEQLQPKTFHEEPAHDFEDPQGEDDNPVPSHASSGDPHEVSDGIFIDPPPPVILSLGDSEEEYYLFNRPSHNSPSADNREVTDDSLFLHDFPTLYYEPLAKVFQVLRSDDRLAQFFDLSRGELLIDAYDLVDLVISEDNSYTNEVSFYDLNLLHDHADLAGPLRIRVGCNPQRFIARYRELKSKLEQLNLLDDADTDDAQLREHYDPLHQPGAHDHPDHLAQHEGDEKLNSERQAQVTTTQHAEDPGPATHTVDLFDKGGLSDDAEPEQAEPENDEESTVGPLSGGEHLEQSVGAVGDDQEPRTATVTDPNSGSPGSTEDPDPPALREQSDDHNTLPPGKNLIELEGVVATNEDYEADYNESDNDRELAEAVAIEGDVKGADWESTASDAQHTQDGLEYHPYQDDVAGGTDTLSSTIDPTAVHDHVAEQQGTDTDSIGQRTLDEFADAQEETRDGSHLHEGEESNSATDQSNEPNLDPDQFGDEFNWDEDFGGDFDGEEFDGCEDQSNMETKYADSQEPASAKRGFDEIDSDTTDERAIRDVSPNSKRKKVV